MTIGLSKPSSFVAFASCAFDARGPAQTEAGLPGTSRTIKNVTKIIVRKTKDIKLSLLNIYASMKVVAPFQ
jgi:hypothetical protein